jgi:hypothetical protein
MRYSGILLALAFGLPAIGVHAQSTSAEDSVKAAVNMLFTGMKTSNAEMIRRSFADSAILQTINKDAIQTDKVEGFASVIAKLAAGDADERIQFDVIRIDGPLAIVWAPYEFYYKGKYSHKGVDSFQLVRVNGVWKIQYLIDTRRK